MDTIVPVVGQKGELVGLGRTEVLQKQEEQLQLVEAEPAAGEPVPAGAFEPIPAVPVEHILVGHSQGEDIVLEADIDPEEEHSLVEDIGPAEDNSLVEGLAVGPGEG